MLIAGIRNNGMCPCPRCLIPKSDLSRLGAPIDIDRQTNERSERRRAQAVMEARHEIVENGYAIDSTKVEAKLKSQSLVPVEVR